MAGSIVLADVTESLFRRPEAEYLCLVRQVIIERSKTLNATFVKY